jgi:hypothetical protein
MRHVAWLALRAPSTPSWLIRWRLGAHSVGNGPRPPSLRRAVEQSYQLVDDGGSDGFWLDTGRDHPLGSNAERRVGAESGFELIFAGFHLASLKITSL